MTFEVVVELKPEVLDAQGRAIKESLQKLGFAELADVRVSKRFLIKLENQSLDGVSAQKKAELIAKDFLANSVSETYSVRRLDP